MKRPSLNHCYRLVWSDFQSAWIAVPESAKGRGKGSKRLLAAVLLAPTLALAAPTGGTVTSGTATISQAGNTTSINQSTQKAAINWQGFSVAGNETVNFNQPNVSAVTLNRVIGNERSVIDGALNANGQVFIVNSAGVLFGKGSSVNVGSLVASTRNISDADFNAGNYVFQGNGNGSVINLGTLTAKEGGYVTLLGDKVSNQGVISATKGTVVLSAGNKITLNFNGDSLLNVTLDEGTLNALVENKQAIYADGGTVLLTAKAADDLLGAQVNNSGIVRARTIDDLTGRVELYAHGGTTSVDGTLDASAPTGGNGGFIETSGDKVKVADSARLLTKSSDSKNGKWLIKPVDFTIASSGGDMTGAFLSNYLDTQGSTTIQSASGSHGSNGDLNINDAVTWSSNNSLTLTAVHDININNAITINGASAGLVMNYGNDYNIRTKASYSGAVLDATGKPVAKRDTSGGIYGSVTFTNSANTKGLTINGNDYTLIYSMSQFDALDHTDSAGNGSFDTVSGYYAIARDWDAAGTTYGIAPVYFFAGTLAGLGHKISHFTMDNPQYSAGLIGNGTDSGPVMIRDLGLEVVHITNSSSISLGTVLGEGEGTLRNLYSTGAIDALGGGNGGLVGYFRGKIDSCYSTVNITNATDGGSGSGIANHLEGEISNSHATGNITVRMGSIYRAGGGSSGGLVGWMVGSVANSYATGNLDFRYADGVPATINNVTQIGGLIGNYQSSSADSLTNSFATGSVTGGAYLGGLIGGVTSFAGINIDNVYATGNVTGLYRVTPNFSSAYIGGLIGIVGDSSSTHSGSVSITNVFATGNVSANGGGSYVGGLMGYAESGTGIKASLRNAYATGDVHVAAVDGVYTLGAGGLIGSANNFSISSVHADGNVSGNGSVGGLIGQAVYSTISDSYAKGAATAYDNTYFGSGGLVGFMNDSSTTNSYYNADANPQAFFRAVGSGTYQVTGLTGSQLADSKYYANGTIGQVTAAREAAAAAAEKEREAAAAKEREAAAAAAEKEREAVAAAAAAAAKEREAAVAAAAKQKVFEEAAVTTGSSQVAQTLGTATPKPSLADNTSVRSPMANILDQNIVLSAAEYSVDIRTIEVDGKIFQLDEEKKVGK
ncbi:filamentous hemagglutinin N-terminal domain-containing protein [Chitinivorax sp. PXF-14]|uniref:two-partner secretion domain-containing protein n=1 Tax=Chitinivorax sp. PXF-14 TaxID=3230488 RepID=UPI0034677780